MRSYPKRNSHKQRLLDDIKLLISAYPDYQSKIFKDTGCVICDKYAEDGNKFVCKNCTLLKFNRCDELLAILDANTSQHEGLDFLKAMRKMVKATPREKLTPWYIKTIGVPRNLQKELKKW